MGNNRLARGGEDGNEMMPSAQEADSENDATCETSCERHSLMPRRGHVFCWRGTLSCFWLLAVVSIPSLYLLYRDAPLWEVAAALPITALGLSVLVNGLGVLLSRLPSRTKAD